MEHGCQSFRIVSLVAYYATCYTSCLNNLGCNMRTKICSCCKIEKPFSEYFKDNKRKIGIRCKCKDCCRIETQNWRNKNRSAYNNYAAMWRAKNPDKQHATDIKRLYKLSIEDYNAMLSAQGCRCKICGAQHDPTRKRGRLYVDHDHETGFIRGLLCSGCNTAIGRLGEDKRILQNALYYLGHQ